MVCTHPSCSEAEGGPVESGSAPGFFLLAPGVRLVPFSLTVQSALRRLWMGFSTVQIKLLD